MERIVGQLDNVVGTADVGRRSDGHPADVTVQSMCCLPMSNGTISMAARRRSAATRAPVGVVHGRMAPNSSPPSEPRDRHPHRALHARREVLEDGITRRWPWCR